MKNSDIKNSNKASNNSYDSTKNHRDKSIGFGKSQNLERVKIPNTSEWQFFRESLEGAASILSDTPQGQSKINAALIWYQLWLVLRPDKPKKGERRIAQQICSDYLGVSRFEFVRTAKALNNAASRFNLEVAS